jgi:hypothetical protein
LRKEGFPSYDSCPSCLKSACLPILLIWLILSKKFPDKIAVAEPCFL